jgi:hypothetical protein
LEISDGSRTPVAPISITVFATISAIGSLRSRSPADAAASEIAASKFAPIQDIGRLGAWQGRQRHFDVSSFKSGARVRSI